MSDQDRDVSLVEQQLPPSAAARGNSPPTNTTDTTTTTTMATDNAPLLPPQQAAPVSEGPEHTDAQADVDETANLPAFEPIFTLLTNATKNTTVHPRVRYLFSDDDTSVLATPQTDPLHRTLIVDLAAPTAANGNWTVSWASSLSPDFAVTSSQLSQQQQQGGSGGSDNSGGGGAGGSSSDADGAGTTAVMLRVEGVEREPVDPKPDLGSGNLPNSGSGVVGREDAESLADEFKRRMGVLKKVVSEEERRKEFLNRQGEEELQLDEDTGLAGGDSERREETKEHE